jgi:hypothetical protein
LDPNDENSWNEIESYMTLNECDDIESLHKLLMTYYEI